MTYLQFMLLQPHFIYRFFDDAAKNFEQLRDLENHQYRSLLKPHSRHSVCTESLFAF